MNKEHPKKPHKNPDREILAFGLQCMLENSFGDVLSLDENGQFGADEKLYYGSKNDVLRGYNKGLNNLKILEEKWEVDDILSIVNLIYIFENNNSRVSVIKLSSWENLLAEWEGIQQLLCLGEIVGDLKNSPVISNSPLIHYLSNTVPASNTEFVCFASQKPDNYEFTLKMLEEIHKTN